MVQAKAHRPPQISDAPAASPQNTQAETRSFVDTRLSTATQLAMADLASASPAAVAQRTRNQMFNQGRPAVAQLVKGKIATAVKAAGFNLEVVNAFQKEAGLKDSEIDTLLKTKVHHDVPVSPANPLLLEFAITLATDRVKSFKGEGNFENFVVLLKQSGNRKHPKAAAPVEEKKKDPLQAIVDEMAFAGVDQLYGRTLATRETAKTIRGILEREPDSMVDIMQCAAAKDNRIAAVEAMLAYNAARHNYDAATILHWASLKGDGVTNTALTDTEHENNIEYLNDWLRRNLTSASPIQYRQLVRFKALLTTTAGVELTREKEDVHYQGGGAGHRTGFLQYVFNDSTMYIHTHWNETEKRLYSMHVQAGTNGTEINNWPDFGEVTNEVLRAQNAAEPTTDPENGVLTL